MANDFSDDAAPPTPLTPNLKIKKNKGLPWKNTILPILLWLFCVVEFVLLFLINNPPKTSIPTPILEIKTSHLPLPSPFCPETTKIAEKECPKFDAIPTQTTAFATPTTPPVRIERLPAAAENISHLAADFFQKGVRHARNKAWRAASDAFFKALHFFPDSPEYAFNLALSLEHLGERRQAIFYYEKALQNTKRQPEHPTKFDKQLLTRHLEELKNNPR